MNLTLVFGMGNGRYPTVSVTEKWALGKAEGWKSLFSPGDPRSKELGWQLSKEHEILQGKKFNTFLNWPEGDSRRSYITNSERFWLLHTLVEKPHPPAYKFLVLVDRAACCPWVP